MTNDIADNKAEYIIIDGNKTTISCDRLRNTVDEHGQQIDILDKKVELLANDLEVITIQFNKLNLSYYNMLSYYYIYGDLKPHFIKKYDATNNKKKKLTICSWFSGGSINTECLEGFGWRLVKYTESGKMVIKRRKQYKYIDLISKKED